MYIQYRIRYILDRNDSIICIQCIYLCTPSKIAKSINVFVGGAEGIENTLMYHAQEYRIIIS
jgi:hypothetical protein